MNINLTLHEMGIIIAALECYRDEYGYHGQKFRADINTIESRVNRAVAKAAISAQADAHTTNLGSTHARS